MPPTPRREGRLGGPPKKSCVVLPFMPPPIPTFIAFCDGPSDLGDGCPSKERFQNEDWGDDRYHNDAILARDMLDEGWYVEMVKHPGGDYPKKFAEVMCPRCKETAGE